MTKLHIILLICIIRTTVTAAWNLEEMEIFDTVEEVGRNFYEVLGISQDAELAEVKKAYRSLSKQLHPDKNDAPDAEVQFRQMVSVYEVIKDEGRRAIYNRVLVEGLPDWRSPIFYFRRARKMSLFEISIILTLVISITQYLMAWGSYIDQKHTLEEFLMKKYKVTKEKRRKKNEDLELVTQIEDDLESIPRPSLWNTLPIQIVKLVVFIFTGGPGLVKQQLQMIKKIKEKEEEEKIRLEEEAQQIKENDERRKEKKAQKKERKRVVNIPDMTGEEYIETSHNYQDKNLKSESEPAIPIITGGPWTEDDFSELSRLMAKFPGGTQGRWDMIAEQMHRTVYEVTKMSSKVKALLINRQSMDNHTDESLVVKVKVKAKNNKEGEKIDLSLGADEKWPLPPQRALEKALKMYPKGADQRWDKIARCVPEKSKEECMIRFKYLADKIKKKKGLQMEEVDITDKQENEDSLAENISSPI